MKRTHSAFAVASIFAIGAGAHAAEPAKAPAVPGIGAGKLVSVSIYPETALIRGNDKAQQLVVTGRYENGGVRDLTAEAKISFSNPALAHVEGVGTVIPTADGKVDVTAEFEGKSAKASLTLESMSRDLPINFTNEIVPIFSKHGCNSGGCHGKSGGQNGFKISLLGFEPNVDYEALTRETRGRRVFPAAPERSLLLLKGIAALPHGGGKRMEPNSPEYKLITRWIRTGMPFGEPTDPKVVRISVAPDHRIIGLRSKQQITVTAHMSDGTTEDVTRRAEYSSNDQEIVSVNDNGMVNSLDLPGEGSVMARYLGNVAVFRATIPLAAPAEKYAKPAPSNYIDKHVFAKLDELSIPPSGLCTDEEFIRRAFIDICGTLPKLHEVQAFLADKSPAKRAKLVDALLERPEYASYFAVKWCDILRNQRGSNNNQNNAGAAAATIAFHGWIRQAMADNMSYDQFVRNVVAAQGNVLDHPPVAWYRELQKPESLVDDTAQAFLGTRVQCARCHHHPYERWSQDDYWGFASFYTRVGRKAPLGSRAQSLDKNIFVLRKGIATNPANGQAKLPRGLAGDEMTIGADEDPRHKLVDWMTDAKNPFFAPALVNRYWAHFFSRGIVEPVDDMRITNPPSNPELLNALAQDFIANKFDLKKLVRTICTSTTYQLSAMPNEHNKSDKQNFARYLPKRLTAEVLLDAIDQVTAAPTTFSALPAGTRAIELPDESQANYFLTVFGKPKRDSACECERSPDANLAQSLHLLNSAEIQAKLTSAVGRAAKLAADPRPETEKLKEVWMIVHARMPTAAELQTGESYIARKTDPKNAASKRQAYEDIFWTLINTKEFLFNH